MSTAANDTTMDIVEQQVIEIVAKTLGKEKKTINPAARIKEDLGADSLSTVELMMAIEAEYEMVIPDEEAQKILTINDIIKNIKLHQK